MYIVVDYFLNSAYTCKLVFQSNKIIHPIGPEYGGVGGRGRGRESAHSDLNYTRTSLYNSQDFSSRPCADPYTLLLLKPPNNGHLRVAVAERFNCMSVKNHPSNNDQTLLLFLKIIREHFGVLIVCSRDLTPVSIPIQFLQNISAT